ncbi:hypothetical protein HDU82_004906 [Entophlyctis luteolus]|nr:hypothetical protein HDU82_004906 [Entophlyctis luteolus]
MKLLLLLAAAQAVASEHAQLRGVAPAKRAVYDAAVRTSAVFACLDGSKSIPASSINDDFCDCPDGSDEPGTAACLNGSFYCTNHGYVGATIPSSRPDPECCDGSDEYLGVIDCLNVCAQVASSAKKARDEESAVRKKGLKTKREYIRYGAKEKALRSEKLKELESERRDVTSKVEELKAVKAEAEQYESHANAARALKEQQRERNMLPKKMANCEQFVQTLKDTNTKLNGRVSELKSILDHLATLREVEEGAAFEALLREKPILQETMSKFEEFKEKLSAAGDSADGTLVTPEVSPEVPDTSASEPSQLSDSDKIEDPDFDLCADPAATVVQCIFQSSNSLIKNVRRGLVYPFEWTGWFKIRTAVKNSYLGLTHSEELDVLRRDATKARKHLVDMENKQRDLDGKISAINNKEKMDFGPGNIWDKLYKECVTMDSFEYNYEVCFLENAKQRNIGGSGGTDLGSFTRWGPRDEGKKGADKYMYMMYENGAHCWNGPRRSVEVQLECGAENRIQAVSEPSKCEYVMRVQTPCACGDSAEDGAEDIPSHNEL